MNQLQSSEQPPDKVLKYRLRFITIHEGQGGVYLGEEKEEEGKKEKEKKGKKGQKRGRKKAMKNELGATDDVAHKEGNNELETTDVAAEKGAHYCGYLCNFASS